MPPRAETRTPTRPRRTGARSLAAAFCCFLIAATSTQGAGPAATPACRPDELLVAFRPGAEPAAVSARHGATVASEIPDIGVFVVAVPPGTAAATLAAFAADADVEFAEPNGVASVPEAPPASRDVCGVAPPEDGMDGPSG